MKRKTLTADEYQAEIRKPKRTHKYNATRVQVDGHWFASIAESRRYGELRLLEKAGKIRDLVLQPRFVLQEAFRDNQGVYFRAQTYVADFMYYDVDRGKTVVEDVKGFETKVFKIKLAWFRKKYDQYHFRLVRKEAA